MKGERGLTSDSVIGPRIKLHAAAVFSVGALVEHLSHGVLLSEKHDFVTAMDEAGKVMTARLEEEFQDPVNLLPIFLFPCNAFFLVDAAADQPTSVWVSNLVALLFGGR